MGISAILSAVSTAFQWGLKLLGLKNSDEMQASADAKTEQKIDEDDTEKVRKAIETGDVSDLRK